MGCIVGVDPKTEKRSSPVYVPRDEQFSDVKGDDFSAATMQSLLHSILPTIAPLLNNSKSFSDFPDIDALYRDGMPLRVDGANSFNNVISRVVRKIKDTTEHVLRFEVPKMLESEHRRPCLHRNGCENYKIMSMIPASISHPNYKIMSMIPPSISHPNFA
jgi:hypothetical protein